MLVESSSFSFLFLAVVLNYRDAWLALYINLSQPQIVARASFSHCEYFFSMSDKQRLAKAINRLSFESLGLTCTSTAVTAKGVKIRWPISIVIS